MDVGVVFLGLLLFLPAGVIISNDGAEFRVVQFPAGGVVIKRALGMLFGHIGYLSLCRWGVRKQG